MPRKQAIWGHLRLSADGVLFLRCTMSRYVGFTGETVIKEEYREDFQALYEGKFSRLKTDAVRRYAVRYGYGALFIKEWGGYLYNDEWKELLPTFYEQDTGLFSYGVTVSIDDSRLFACINNFMYLLTLISEEKVPRRCWDELGRLTPEELDSMSDRELFSKHSGEDILAKEMSDMC